MLILQYFELDYFISYVSLCSDLGLSFSITFPILATAHTVINNCLRHTSSFGLTPKLRWSALWNNISHKQQFWGQLEGEKGNWAQ